MALASDADRLRWYGGPEGVAKVDAYIAKLAAEAPPLTVGQAAKLRALGLSFRAAAPETAPQTRTTPPVPALPAPDTTEVQAA